MKKFYLSDMNRGWFIGDFSPSIIKTQDVEVAVKKYQKGEFEARHHHKIASEVTVVIAGIVRMNADVCTPGDMLLIEPGESVDFEVFEDAITVVVKYPGARDDKYMGDIC